MKLNTIQPALVPRALLTASVAVSAAAGARLQAAATKVRSPVQAASTKSVSKAARCLCIVVCRSAASHPGHMNSSLKFALSDLEKLGLDEVNLADLINANVIKSNMKDARVILSGEITRKVTVRGMSVTKGAKAAIEAAGGSVVVDADK